MIVFARGAITEPDKLGPFVNDEMRVVGQLKDEGVVKAVYRRAAGPGVLLPLEGDSIDAIRAGFAVPGIPGASGFGGSAEHLYHRLYG